jgi:hypothetical protein
MKKVLLTSLSIMLAGFCTAQIKVEPAKVNVNAIPELVKPYSPPTVLTGNGQFMPNNSSSSQARMNDRRSGSISYVKIGNTLYDLQTNSSIPRRIILHPDGKITATFTTSTDPNFANRGTGYNHFNGTNWMTVSAQTPRIESSRTGWPAIGIYNGNKEYILGHVAETGGFILSKNQGIGQTTFNESNVLIENNALPIWGRTASNNQNIIHVISGYTQTDAIPAPVKNGVIAPLNYSRSRDAGVTWDLLGEITNNGSNYTSGNYSNMNIMAMGSFAKITADITISGGSVSSFVVNDFSNLIPNQKLRLWGVTTELTSTLDSTSQILNLHSNNAIQLNIGAEISSSEPGTFAPNTLIDSILNDSIVRITNLPLRNGLDSTIVFTPPYGDGLFFEYTVGNGHVLLPGYDSTRIEGGSADNYSIDCRDSIVAIVTGRLGHDVILWKSTNNGGSFTKIYVDSFPFDPTKFRERITNDTVFCSDGTSDVFIDEDGTIHVFFALSEVFTNPNDNEAYFFRPATVGLVYWNDFTEEQVLVTDYIPFDRDNNNVIDLNPGNWNTLVNGQIPPGMNSVARLGNTSLLRMPSSGIDADGNIYVVFTVPVEYATDFNLLNYRDIFIMHSTDGGVTWEGPQNLTQTFQLEEDFVSMAKVVDDYVHIIYQRDNIPGTNLQNNAEGSNNHGIPSDGNDIFYAAIPKSEILAGTIGNTWGLNVEDLNKEGKLFVVSQNYPNPFTGETTVTVYLSQFTSNINIDVIDITGKQVYTHQIQNLTQGNHDITIDGSNLKSGVYYYTISTGNSTQTRKMIVH